MPLIRACKGHLAIENGDQRFELYRVGVVPAHHSFNTPAYFHPDLDLGAVYEHLDTRFNVLLNRPATIYLWDVYSNDAHPLTFTPIAFTGDRQLGFLLPATAIAQAFEMIFDLDRPLELQDEILLKARDHSKCTDPQQLQAQNIVQ